MHTKNVCVWCDVHVNVAASDTGYDVGLFSFAHYDNPLAHELIKHGTM